MTDEGFEGFDTEGTSLPDVALDFSVKSDCVTNPDVIVDVKETLVDADETGTLTGDIWVRIPVTHTELFKNKDGPAHITRTAKVEFPAEWGGQDISQYINGFQSSVQPVRGDAYDECRIFMRDQESDEWQVVHYGYVGGVGPAADEGVFKFWCYDAADLLKGIQVSKAFGEPTVAQVIDFVLNGDDDSNREVGLNERSVFENVGAYVFSTARTDGHTGPKQIAEEGIATNIYADEDLNVTIPAQKRFQVNRNNMVDVMNWLTSEAGGEWHFEPTPEGPVLYIDGPFTDILGSMNVDEGLDRRVFVEEAVVEWWEMDDETDDAIGPSGFSDFDVYSSVDVLDNQMLYDIKPFNTLYLYGEATTYRERDFGFEDVIGEPIVDFAQNYSTAGSPGGYTEEYPYVKITHETLLERAGGYEYSSPPVESDKVYLESLKKEAVSEFREHLAEESEGSMAIRGEPFILPFDYIRAVPTCNDTFPNADADPLTYEVNAVKHVRSAGEDYRTELRCAIAFSENDLNIEARYETA